jgi:hypothetical protein
MKSQNAALTGEAMRSISGNGKTAVIGLTKGREAVVDECDVAWLGAFTWHYFGDFARTNFQAR